MSYVEDFIRANKKLIDASKWDEFYYRVNHDRNPPNRSELNKILEGSGILYTSILHSITEVPFHFLEGCEHIPNPLVLPPNIREIRYAAFAFCDKLIDVIILDSVTNISDYAFEGCSGLTTITISEGVTSIGQGAFQDCTGLTSVTIPRSVVRIGMHTFSRCNNLKELTFRGTKAQWRAVKKGDGEDYYSWKYFSDIHIIHCVDGDIEI